jgi:hypothetical protein
MDVGTTRPRGKMRTQMKNSMSYATVILAMAWLTSACTAGVVKNSNGTPVKHSKIKFVWYDPEANCQLTGKAITTTNADGQFVFNPYSETSSDFDWSKVIPQAWVFVAIENLAQDEDWYNLHPSNGQGLGQWLYHKYDDTCQATVNNEKKEVPCKLYDITVASFYELSGFKTCMEEIYGDIIKCINWVDSDSNPKKVEDNAIRAEALATCMSQMQ